MTKEQVMPDYNPNEHPERWLLGACSSGDPLRWAVVAVCKEVEELTQDLADVREATYPRSPEPADAGPRRIGDELSAAEQQANLATLTAAARDLDEYIHAHGWVRLDRSDPRAIALRAALAK